MMAEICEQPAVLRRFGPKDLQAASQIAAVAAKAPFVLIAARGTSDHAAAYAKYLLEVRCGIPVALAAPSVKTLYGTDVRANGALAIGISQSGAAPDVCEVIASARAQGAVTVAITNEPESPLAATADHLLEVHAGTETAVAATKTYTGTLAAIYILAAALRGDPQPLDRLAIVAGAMEQALTASDAIRPVAERCRFMEECVVLGRGFNYPTAMETALKIIETSYVLAKSYSSADFLHGPIALLHGGFPCILFANSGPALHSMREQAELLIAREAELIVFSDDDEMLALARCPIRAPVTLADELSPMVNILFGQLFAHHLAVTRGHDPDHPRALNKITKTI